MTGATLFVGKEPLAPDRLTSGVEIPQRPEVGDPVPSISSHRRRPSLYYFGPMNRIFALWVMRCCSPLTRPQSGWNYSSSPWNLASSFQSKHLYFQLFEMLPKGQGHRV